MSLATVSIVGNLVRMPEQMCFSSGKIKTTLTVAVNSFGKPSRGGDSADFYRVEAWGKLAELAAKYLEKGNQVAVSGRLMFDRFVDQQGKNRMVPIVEANQLSLPPKPRTANESGEKDSSAEIAVAAMSGHLLVDSDEEVLDDPEESKVVAMENKAKNKNRKVVATV
jgi:single-strand DNA-binding protein